ncbi:MAG: DUF692 family protein [Chloroflexi bacterium]|nr:DUF692 family protein [Chloroflexota bacterium]MCY4247411.1 DUF692 family protein [Chloroflexota bacterium]
MQFAINYSPQALRLWREGAIQVDLFKCPDWHDLVAEVSRYHSLYVHCSLIVGQGRLVDVDMEALAGWLDTGDTQVINTHLCMLRSSFAPGQRITREAVVTRGLRELMPLCERFGPERVVIENLAYPTRAWRDDQLAESVDPAVISAICDRSGCGLLLDLAHAIRACEGTSASDIHGYLDALPVHRLRELHVVGLLPKRDELGIREDHFAMNESDWAIADYALGQIRAGEWRHPERMAFEYGGIGEKFAFRSDPAVIAAQAPRLYALAKSA